MRCIIKIKNKNLEIEIRNPNKENDFPKEKVKVLIFYASFGGGHLSASNSIADYLTENYNVEVYLNDAQKYLNKLMNKISINFYNSVSTNAPNLYGFLYDRANENVLMNLIYSANSVMSNKLHRLIKTIDPDIIISTHPFASQICGYLVKKDKLNIIMSTIITDYEIHQQWFTDHQYVDYIFVGSDKMKTNLIKQGVEKDEIIVSGIPFKPTFLKEYDRDKVYEIFNLDKSKETIIFFGGGKYGYGGKIMFQTFKGVLDTFYDHNIVTISGKNEKNKEKFKNILNEKGNPQNVKLLEFTDKIPELMSIAKFIVSKTGGLTTTEALVTGTPMVIINPLPGQEIANTEFILEIDAGVYIKEKSDINPILNKLKNNPDKLKNMSQNAKLHSKPNATKIICESLINRFVDDKLNTNQYND